MEMDHTSGLETETELHISEQVATSVEGMLQKLTPLSAECCIYTVPQKLRKVKEEAYEPSLFSIGPLHHGKKNLVAMEEHKLRYLQTFLSRHDKTLKEYVEIISNQERNIRDSYSESIKLSSEDFLKMILVDGCFIIEVILRFCHPEWREPNDRIYDKPWLISDVGWDMTLLENQLPFFLLQSLYNLAFPEDENVCSFLILSFRFFERCLQMPKIESPQVARKISSDYKVKHFVDLLRVCHKPSSSRSSTDPSKRINILIPTATGLHEAGVRFRLGSKDNTIIPTATELHEAGVRSSTDNTIIPIQEAGVRSPTDNTIIPTATELHEAGVRFELSSKDKPLLDIVFRSDRVLEIPKLRLHDKWESLFRNLIAFEECHYQEDTYITDYIHFMDQLINTTEDVDILVKKGIIDNWLGNNVAITNLFNNLLIETTFQGENFYFADIFTRLNAYCDVPWNRRKATLIHEYFSSPWRGASTIAAVILLLTLIQTIFSCMSPK